MSLIAAEESADPDRQTGARAEESGPRHRWWILATIGLAQLMVVLDATIVNIALPSAQADLGFSDGNRAWIVTAYSLAFGSMLLLGGRIAAPFRAQKALPLRVFRLAAASAARRGA